MQCTETLERVGTGPAMLALCVPPQERTGDMSLVPPVPPRVRIAEQPLPVRRADSRRHSRAESTGESGRQRNRWGGLMSEHFELPIRCPPVEGSRWPSRVDALIPMPLHPRRQRSRGYNQSAFLAREIGRRASTCRSLSTTLLRTRQKLADRRWTWQSRGGTAGNNVAGNFACRY